MSTTRKLQIVDFDGDELTIAHEDGGDFIEVKAPKLMYLDRADAREVVRFLREHADRIQSAQS